MGWSRRQVGLTYYDPGRAYPGYTLLVPNGGDNAYLIDMEGSIVHQWRFERGFGECHLLPNGHLLFRAARSADRSGFPGVPVMEDYELVRRLRRMGRIDIAKPAVVTSARRWLENGVWRPPSPPPPPGEP